MVEDTPSQQAGGALDGAPKDNTPSWKRSWTLHEMRDSSRTWTLASDAGVST